MEFCEVRNEMIICIRAVQGHSHGVTINPTLFSLRDTVELERTQMAHGQLFQLETKNCIVQAKRSRRS